MQRAPLRRAPVVTALVPPSVAAVLVAVVLIVLGGCTPDDPSPGGTNTNTALSDGPAGRFGDSGEQSAGEGAPDREAPGEGSFGARAPGERASGAQPASERASGAHDPGERPTGTQVRDARNPRPQSADAQTPDAQTPGARNLVLGEPPGETWGERSNPATIPPGALVIRGGWLFDGTSDERIANPGVVIADGEIRTLGIDDDLPLPGDALAVELTGEETIIPGLFDLHAHYAVDLLGQGRIDETSVYPMVFLANGVTSTFPAGEVNPVEMRSLRFRIDDGELAGPRIWNSGPYFGSWREGWSDDITADSIRDEVDYWIEQGAHAFKAKGISPRHLGALIEAAHAHGATVTGHLGSGAGSSVNPRDAIRMGIDRIEHFMGGDAMPADRSAYASLERMTPETPGVREAVELYIETGTYFDATITAYGYYGEQEPEVFEDFADEMGLLTPWAREQVEERLPRPVNDQFERIYRAKHELLRAFHDWGGAELITLGTDHPSWGQFFSGFGVHREMHAMVRAGIPPASVLRIATINGARALGLDDRLGTVEEGKWADLVILSGNPLEDIRATRSPRLVVRGGELFDPRELLAGVWGRLGPAGPDEAAGW